MPILVFSLAQIVGVLLGAAALAYLVLALRALRRFRERPARAPDWHWGKEAFSIAAYRKLMSAESERVGTIQRADKIGGGGTCESG